MVVVFNLLSIEGAMLQLLLLVLLQLRRPLRVRPAEEITIIHENENEIHERKIFETHESEIFPALLEETVI